MTRHIESKQNPDAFLDGDFVHHDDLEDCFSSEATLTIGIHNRPVFLSPLPPSSKEDGNESSLSKQTSHWSIAWSDLMMTMFILFLSLFVYQMTQNKILEKEKEKLLTENHENSKPIMASQKASLPFPRLPTPAGQPGDIQLTTNTPLQEINLTASMATKNQQKETEIQKMQAPPPHPAVIHKKIASPQTTIMVLEKEVPAADDTLFPRPLLLSPQEERQEKAVSSPATETAGTPGDSVDTLYIKGKDALTAHALDKFAAIELIPDKAVHIVLTGDLLFSKGEALLNADAIDALGKIGMAIENSADIVHIEGHTDDIPITANGMGSFNSNWDLSLARANAVASFLLEKGLIDPERMVISGYSSYRPVVPNDSEKHRAQNRRVEIVITKNSDNPSN